MRITILNKYYPPDISPTARLAESLALDRARRGDQVTVVCSSATYAGVEEASPANSTAPAVKVCKLWAPGLGRSSLWRRCVDYAVFYLLAVVQMLRLPRQDVIVVMTTPPLIAWAAIAHKWWRGSEIVLWNMDCYPEVLENTGVVRKNGWIATCIRRISKIMFRHVTHTVCLDAAMRELVTYAYSTDTGELETTVIPNWEPVTMYADDVVVSHTTAGIFDSPVQDDFMVLYSGNMGAGHTFETVLDTAEAMSHTAVTFRFNGSGSRRQEIQLAKQQRQLENIVINDYAPRENLLTLMGAADCALITLRDDMLGVMSPSKLHANLAMGVPVLYIGPEGSNVDEAIRTFECGVSLRPGDTMGAVEFIGRLMEDPAYHARLAARSRRAFLMVYCDHQTLPQFDKVIQGCVEQPCSVVAAQQKAA